MSDEQDNIVSDLYDNYSETQKEVLAIELRKTRNMLFYLAAIQLIGEWLSLVMVSMFTVEYALIGMIVPIMLFSLAFLAMKEPMLSIVIAAVIIIGLWIYLITLQPEFALKGWLARALMIFLLISGFQHAKEAMKIKRELKEKGINV